jgi:chromosome segregation ATPase
MDGEPVLSADFFRVGELARHFNRSIPHLSPAGHTCIFPLFFPRSKPKVLQRRPLRLAHLAHHFFTRQKLRTMLEERLHLLEEKVASLLGELKKLRKQNAAQQQEIGTLGAKADRTESLEQENARLLARVKELEGELASGETKEEEIRERLRSIIEKIDSLEDLSDTE